ncbi:phosphoglycerate dehydrogenase [Neobacillus notoginsengisoli]|uniref:D-3-phosphoglycerate dehydrogenase n=1 Tax=Neobacillus notoginsengisoli TaxID=1578198 RepID=A0A417YWH8_9BACI|nr:phosphoglycerate dehydrogenase [Neobacillus notoginsengisoli]RHW41638.1 phosphoglycerate dehydrogenase [Neobacillus notoginsengisoli]
MFKVLITDRISDSGLRALYEHPLFTVDKQIGLSHLDLVSIIKHYDALIVRSQTEVTGEVIQQASRLQVIARAGVGVDNIDVKAATRKGIIVINAPGANTIAATEHTLAMLLAVARNLPQAHRITTEGEWNRGAFQGVELYRKTLGIIGMGKIGTEVAKRAKSFGMEVLGFDPYFTEERAAKLGIKKATLDEIAVFSDFITLHTPLTNATENLIDEAFLQKVKPGVRLINCARGGIIDEDALVAAVGEGRVAGAALDVFQTEPPTNQGLLGNPRIVMTPHLGASTVEAQEKVAEEVSTEIIEILEKKVIRHAVNMPQMTNEALQNLQPYLRLGEQIGQLVIQLLNDAPDKVEIDYYGDLIKEDTDLISRSMIKGLLTHHLGDSVNLINALHLLNEQGVPHTVRKNTKNKGFANYLEMTVHHGEESACIGATVLNGYGERIVKINQYRIDVKPERHLLFINHHDMPGIIGKVGALLGDQQINIGTMQVGRTDIGGNAIMVLTLDKPIYGNVLKELTAIEGLREAQLLEAK